MNKALLTLACLAVSAMFSGAQGSFQNLDFESARLIFVPPNSQQIATTNALPYWSAYYGTNLLSSIPYIGYPSTPLPVDLQSRTNGGVIDGNYDIFLGYYPSSFGFGSATNTLGSISQTGLVPAGVQSLLFKGNLDDPYHPITVSLGGLDLSYVAISNALNYTLYGAAIPPSLAGQTETLIFSAGANGQLGGGILDDIEFSTVLVPEPSSISLLCLGGGTLFYLRRRRRKRVRL
jgi:hypothetical protein